jgi:predicted molibdopterin-dependent oxidoreductase YjgC
MPQSKKMIETLNKLELLVVQDILNTRTAAAAHVVLPGAAFSEKQGSFTNMEGRIQRFDAAVKPPEPARPDWRILLDIYDKLAPSPGKYRDIKDIRKEIRDHVPGYDDLELSGDSGSTSPRFRRATNNHVEADYLGFQDSFSRPHGAVENDAYPFTAILVTPRSHVGGGTRTSRSKRLAEFTEKGEIELNQEDFSRLGVEKGGVVRVTSPKGSIERAVISSRRVSPGHVLIPTGVHGNCALELADLSKGGFPMITCHVRIENI